MTSNIANVVRTQHSATIHTNASPPSTPITPEIPILDERPPTPHSITDSNEDVTSYLSICCNKSCVDALGSVSGTLTQKKKTKGPIIRARLLKHVLLYGRIRVEYHPDMKATNKFVHDKLVRAVGSYIRGKTPMIVSRYGKLSGGFMTHVYNHLSTNFEIDEADLRLHKYLKDMTKNRFKEWKHECRKKVAQKTKTVIEVFKQSQPSADEGFSDGATYPIMPPIETKIKIIMEEIPHKQGTIVTGFGPSVHRSPKKRGGSRTIRAKVEEISRRLQESEKVRRQEADARRKEDEARRKEDVARRVKMEANAKEIEELKKANAEHEENNRKCMEDMLARVQFLLAGKGISGADLMG